MNISIQVFVWTYAFNLDYYLGVMCFKLKLPNVSIVVVSHFTFPPAIYTSSSSSEFLLTLGILDLINFSHSKRCVVLFHHIFNCVSLKSSDGVSFHVLICHVCVFFVLNQLSIWAISLLVSFESSLCILDVSSMLLHLSSPTLFWFS